MCGCVWVVGWVWLWAHTHAHVDACALGDHRQASDPPELGSEAAVSCLTGVLGIKCKLQGRERQVLVATTPSLQPPLLLF